MNEIDNIIIEVLIKNENDLENGKKIDNLTDIEIYYITLAIMMPFDCILKDIENYKKRWLITDELKYTNELMKKYSCTKRELYDRIYIVLKMKRYKEKKNSQIIKEQKRMIKVLNKKREFKINNNR